MNFFEIMHISYIFTGLLLLVLLLIIYFRDRRNIVNQLFSLEIISALIWIFTALLTDTSKDYSTALFWSKVAIIGPAFIPYFFLLFSYVFPIGRLPSLKKIITLFLPAIFFILLSPTNLNVKDIKIEQYGTSLNTGILYPLLFIYFVFYIGIAFYNFVKKYKISNKIQKYQIKYILIGYSTSLLIGILTNLILVSIGRSEYSIFGPPSTIFFVILTTYAVIKHHLFEIRVILTEFLMGVIGVVLLIQVFSAVSLAWMILNIIIFGLFCFFGYLLIKSVLREIKYREQLQGAYQELKVLDKAKSEFISMASHQLRTPLSAIKGYISMLLEGSYGPLSEKVKEKMKNVFQSNERLIKLINDLLNISKIELGRIEIEKKFTQIEDLIQSCYDEMKIEAEKKGLKFVFQKPKISLPKINIDQLKIRQVILNLIDNAIRYTQKGEIKIKTEKINLTIWVSVKDTGEGLSKEERENIFGGFTRGSAGLTFFIEGAGLGLYVAQKFIKLHNGKIWAESAGKGRGSTFYVELPIR